MNNHHHINYIEFPATDLDLVKKFYSAAFGWTFTDFSDDYVGFNDGVLDGGFAKSKGTTHSGPLVILYSSNLQATLETVTQHGGIIVEQIYEFPGGKRFHFTDPAGNELAVWSEK